MSVQISKQKEAELFKNRTKVWLNMLDRCIVEESIDGSTFLTSSIQENATRSNWAITLLNVSVLN